MYKKYSAVSNPFPFNPLKWGVEIIQSLNNKTSLILQDHMQNKGRLTLTQNQNIIGEYENIIAILLYIEDASIKKLKITKIELYLDKSLEK